MMDDRRTRLRGLGPDVLADAILDLADQYDEAEKLVERLLAPADKADSRIKDELNALKGERRNYDWDSAKALAIKVHMLLSNIPSSIHGSKGRDADAHVGFHQYLQERHGRKRSFWAQTQILLA